MQHVGIRRYQTFLRKVYNLLSDDGIFVFQVAGLREGWQFEDLIWCVSAISPWSSNVHMRLVQGSVHEQVCIPGCRCQLFIGMGCLSGQNICCVAAVCVLIAFRHPQLQTAGFEVKNIDVLGVHYSATIFRWYKNWLSNEEKIKEAYGERWFRVWSFFLAYSTIVSRFVSRYLRKGPFS